MIRAARVLGRSVIAIAIAALTLAPVQASGPGAAASFAILGNDSIYLGKMKVLGPAGDVGAYRVELTDKVGVRGNAIASAGYNNALELGDFSTVRGKCVTGGGSIGIVAQFPAKCLGGMDITGGDALLTNLSNALSDAATLTDTLSALTPTQTLAEINVPDHQTTTLSLGPGVNVIDVQGRFLVGSFGRLVIRAPAGASVVFLVSGSFSPSFRARIVLGGGIKPDSVAYVLSGTTLLGASSLVPGTIIATSSTCLVYAKAKITGALICSGGIAFSDLAKMTFAPLRAVFP